MEHKLLHPTVLALTLLALVSGASNPSTPSTTLPSTTTSHSSDTSTTHSPSSHPTSNTTPEQSTATGESNPSTPSTTLPSAMTSRSDDTSTTHSLSSHPTSNKRSTAEHISSTPSTALPSTTSSYSEVTSTGLQPASHTTSKTTQEPPTGPMSTPQEQHVVISLSFHITNRIYNKSLSNRSSEDFRELDKIIGEVYQAVYNCSTCPDHEDYLGYHVIEFRNGSVVADSQINFRENSNTSSPQFVSQVESRMKNASNETLQGLNLTDIKAEHISSMPSPTLPSTTSGHSEATTPILPPSSHSTSKPTQKPPTGPTPTPQEQTVAIALRFRITNRIFNESLLNESSEYFQQLNRTIGEMYQAVYNCSTCPDHEDYLGYHVIAFRNGSVVTDSQINFRENSNTSSPQFVSQVESRMKNASNETLKSLNLTDVTAEHISSTPSPTLPSTTSGHSEATTPTLRPSSHSTSKPTEKPSTGPMPTPQEQTVAIALRFRITNRIFNESLLNESSEYFQQLNRTIGEMYQAVYNCSTCPDHEDYLGYHVIAFRNGSVVTDSQINFQENSNTSSPQFVSQVESRMKNASNDTLKGLNLTDVTAEHISSMPSPTLPSTTSGHSEATTPTLRPSSHSTSKPTEKPSTGPMPTPQEQTVAIALRFRITNRIFNESLLNESSEYFQQLNRTIGEMYQAVYNCSTCPDHEDYLGYHVIAFRNGSVVADSQINFRENSNTSSPQFVSQVESRMKNASNDTLKGLNLTDITAERLSSTSSPTLPSTTSSHSKATPPTLQPSSSETTEKPPTGPMPTPQEQTVEIALRFRITNRIFNESLLNESSEYFQQLNRTIGEMYQEVFNCSTCPDHEDYLGYHVIAFRNGSVVTESQINFRENSNTSSPQFVSQVESRMKNASNETLQGLNLTDIKAERKSSTPSPTLPSTTSSHSKATPPTLPPSSSETTEKRPTGPTPTPQEQIMEILLTFRIINKIFNESLLDSSSDDFQKLDKTIGEVYQEVFNCSTCPDHEDYLGYHVIAFRNGSVVTESQLNFRENSNTASPQFVSQVESRMKSASSEALKGLNLTDIKAERLSSTPSPTLPSTITSHSEANPPTHSPSSHTTSKSTQKPTNSNSTGISPTSLPSTSSTSASDAVPGWGIALLVLVSVILLLALIAFLLLIIYWCRRHHRGSLDLLSSRDSYHPMNEYPTYHTHGRYAAPSSKQNPYNESLPKNGTNSFSYTNPAMANDNL